MANIEIKYDDRKVRRMLKRLSRRVSDMTPVMREIGGIVRTSVIKNFEVGGRYKAKGSIEGGAKRWRPRKKSRPQRILIQSGRLMGSINARPSSDSVKIGPDNVVYGAIHQLGGKAGRGKKVTIPARPYLVIQQEDKTEMIKAIDRHLKKGVRG